MRRINLFSPVVWFRIAGPLLMLDNGLWRPWRRVGVGDEMGKELKREVLCGDTRWLRGRCGFGQLEEALVLGDQLVVVVVVVIRVVVIRYAVGGGGGWPKVLPWGGLVLSARLCRRGRGPRLEGTHSD